MNCSAHSPNRVSRPWIGEGERRRSPEDSQNQGDTPRFPGRTRLPECCCTGLNEEGREQSQSIRGLHGAGGGNPYSVNISLCNCVGKWRGTFLKM